LIEFITRQVSKHGRILKYLCFSIITALLETVCGWIILRSFRINIIIANTAAIIISTVLHYFLTLFFVFHKEINYKNIIAYIITFILGILIQNAIIWLFYSIILAGAYEPVRYTISKCLSLAIPFFALYNIRNKLYNRI
jgi:putative flippase GtrA